MVHTPWQSSIKQNKAATKLSAAFVTPLCLLLEKVGPSGTQHSQLRVPQFTTHHHNSHNASYERPSRPATTRSLDGRAANLLSAPEPRRFHATCSRVHQLLRQRIAHRARRMRRPPACGRTSPLTSRASRPRPARQATSPKGLPTARRT